ncbi:GGDEF domain-containing protein [Aliikangiella sp. IMCC44359]|uniref:GGDEF domain-containing protein n=1 Tax=Aliikangiella sp. IMCC44359 TaxID=3459125 RepID=UPI00403AD186
MSEIQIQELVEEQAELKRCVSRLSYVGMGISDELDELLKQLRDGIKSDSDINELKNITEKISKLLLTIEDEQVIPRGKIEVIEHDANFMQLFKDSRLPSDLKIELQKVQQKIQNDEAVKISKSIVDVILNYVNSVESTPKPSTKKKGFFSNLFQSNKQQEISDEHRAAPLEQVPDELRTSLQHLIDQLSAIDHYQEVAIKLTEKVMLLNSIAELADILELITGAFVNIASHEHEQLERFLKSLDKRIERVNSFINNTSQYSQQVTKNSNLLDQEIKGSVIDIKNDVESATSLPELKEHVYQKIDSILSKVNQFCTQQESNEKKLQKSINSLQEQLRATEDESSRLKEEFAEQRMRAQTDPLTHLPNRYSYNERLTQEYNRWRRYRSPLSLVICDIDHFKQVNDEYGHAAGDQVLKEIAHYLQASLRESDFVARFGGEEFVILLPETPLIDATKAMNKLRQGVKEVKVTYEAQTISIAMSIGISEFENSDTAKAVFSRADQALYRAKEKGRDQVCCQRASKNS